MNKVLILAILSIGLTTQAETELLGACAMADGALAHKIELIDGKHVGRFDFPTYRELDTNVRSLNAPLANNTMFTSGLDFLNKKAAFLKNIFGEKHTLIVDFEHCEKQTSKNGELKAMFCNTTKDIEINGEKVERIDFGLQNQIRTSLVGSDGETADFNVFYADLTFKTASDSFGKQTVYKSSMTYWPNGQSIQCSIK